MNQLYNTVGITKQAVHQYACRQTVFDQQLEQLEMEADELRGNIPVVGLKRCISH